MPDLFSPVRLGPYALPNRIVMAPMTRNRAGPGETPTALMATYYAQRASAGLIVTEGTQITPEGQGYPGTPGIHSPAQVAGWRAVVDAVHARGGKIFCQLWHVGRVSHPLLQPGGALPVAPSALAPAGKLWTLEGMRPFETPRALATEEIARLLADYRTAAANARAAGFDGVEVHAANGYLIDQFLRSSTNRRTDRYGGSIENRTRLLLEVTQALIAEFGAARVGVRLSPTNPFNDIADEHPAALFGHAAAALDRLDLAYLHIVEPGPDDPIAQGERPDGPFFRARWRGRLILNKGYDARRASAAIADGVADLVAFATLFLANPDLPERLRRGGPFNAPDRPTFYGGGEKGYTDYPALA
ncbi:MAG TPA: alkene reductase [Xanthobacteraceae bacterium]|nr:alkene reductase [Xanthobacteraceae bacterium]